MKYEWMLEVLTDMRDFAQKNNMPLLASQLGDTLCVANLETMSFKKKIDNKTDEGHVRSRDLLATAGADQ